MPSFASHLERLIDPTSHRLEPIDLTNQEIEQWIRYSDDFPHVPEDVETFTDGEPPYASILDLPWAAEEASGVSTDTNINPIDALYIKLASNPRVSPLLPALASVLSSPKKDEEISGEIADMFGFDAIELVMEVISNRLPLSYKLAIVDDGAPVGLGRATPRSGKATPQSGRATPLKKGKSRGQQANGGVDFTADDAKRRLEASLRAAAARPLFTGIAPEASEVLPHVYTSSSMVQGNVLSTFGTKYLLPMGTTRYDREDCEEVTIPPAKPIPPRSSEKLILVDELDGLAKGSFPGYATLNRIQSIVYPTAYGTNENLLICAPTGAGKTDVAMLTILRVIDQNLSSPDAKSTPGKLASVIRRDDFKIIYVAPMKALAAEIVRKLGKRLAWLSIRVRELTGDMQMTKTEIAETQIIVTTPEKWDVVTRKPTGEGELASKVKLLIIDEVHLLNEERGAVIETIVARTLRQVESTQSLIRVIGLSATLPNYIDVADFLRVSRYNGLFYFDSSFRPIPLEQHFLGIKGKTNSQLAKRNLDRVTYQKVMDLVQQGHQVMVFVHARKETVKSAQALREAALLEGTLDDFSSQEHPQFSLFRRDIGTSRNKELKELFNDGFGIHHAGMLRSDRNMVERMFEARAIKVLCCTATLAWGVNLPAHAVIIKGTQVYDSSRGAFVDLSVLDVLQIFGRAGRPGMETSGEGYICTSEDKLTHYLDAVTAQHPIESKFIAGMVDSLNAEISLGTVANIKEAIQWIGYTYLFVRMRRNPIIYGMTHDEPADDPQLGNKRHQLVTAAARKLAEARMITFNENTGSLVITDLGRIAAKYYIRTASIEIFNKEFRPVMREADVLGLLSMSTEFDQVQLRENEIKELKRLMDDVIPCEVKGGTDTSQGKVNILLQGYISRAYIEDFALVSDTAYVAQNGGRIIRGLLEIALSRKWASVCAALMAMSKGVEKRMWPFEHPLTQFDLSQDVLHNLQQWADEWSVAEIASENAADLGQLIHMNERHGAALLKVAKQFPTVILTYRLRPLSSDLLKICIHISKDFEWNTRLHGSAEPFWLWVEDHDGVEIIQWSHLLLRQNTVDLDVDFVIPIRGSEPPSSVNLRFLSDRWMGAEDEVRISLDRLIMPVASDCHTPLLELPFLPANGRDATSSPFYKMPFRDFNGIQTQCFWTLVHTKQNALVCAPAGSGKSTLAVLALCQQISKGGPGDFGVVIVPNRSSAKEIASLVNLSRGSSHISIDITLAPDSLMAKRDKGVRITTPRCLLDSLRRNVGNTWLSELRIVLCENLEILNAEYELAVSLLVHQTQALPVRFIGLANCLNDPADLALWLHVPPLALFSFRPSDRDQSLTVKAVSFTTPHSTALFKAMAKPAHSAIREASAGETAILFVPSRAQCQGVAVDLITQCAMDIDTRGFLGRDVSPEDLELYLSRLHNNALSDLISHGIGIFHEGVHRADLALTLQLYLEGIVRVLIVAREACWTVPVHAGVVIVMGAQYINIVSESDRQVRQYSIQELAKMQACAVRYGLPGTFHLFCQAEQCDTFMRFLNEGLPLESELTNTELVAQWVQEMRRQGSIVGKQDCLEALSLTFLARRLETNPTYYDAILGKREQYMSRYVDRLWSSEL
ncbi:Sec63-domain-containing protein [Ramaria rubella]|nr:Sec63-domain-containing protein [Ramaria rubella]